MGSSLLNFLLVRVKLLIWWDFCRFFKVLLEQLLKFLLNRLSHKGSLRFNSDILLTKSQHLVFIAHVIEPVPDFLIPPMISFHIFGL